MEKVRPWCGQPSDRGRLKDRTSSQNATSVHRSLAQCSPRVEPKQRIEERCGRWSIATTTVITAVVCQQRWLPRFASSTVAITTSWIDWLIVRQRRERTNERTDAKSCANSHRTKACDRQHVCSSAQTVLVYLPFDQFMTGIPFSRLMVCLTVSMIHKKLAGGKSSGAA